MTTEDWPPPSEPMVPFLIRKGRFIEAVVVAWQDVEDLVDQMVVQEFELMSVGPGEDPRVDMIRDAGFGRKVDFLRKMGRLSEPDCAKIFEFSKARNLLFHGGVYTNPHPMTLPQAQKDRMAKIAGEASRIVTNRVFNVWWQAETNDLTNKGIPQPEKPSAVKRLAEWKKDGEKGFPLEDSPPK